MIFTRLVTNSLTCGVIVVGLLMATTFAFDNWHNQGAWPFVFAALFVVGGVNALRCITTDILAAIEREVRR